MKKIILMVLTLIMTVLDVYAENDLSKFEGLLGSPVESVTNMNGSARSFIPYNPIIVEIGAFEGEGTLSLAQSYPYGKIFAFEPLPQAFSILEKKLHSMSNVCILNLAMNTHTGVVPLWVNGSSSSLIKSNDAKEKITVPCSNLDQWCKKNGIDHVDFLRLDIGGFEWKIIQSSPAILKTVIVVVTKTYLSPSTGSIISYSLLKKLLESQGFELLSHWYKEGKEGEAIFIRKYMYDSLFR